MENKSPEVMLQEINDRHRLRVSQCMVVISIACLIIGVFGACNYEADSVQQRIDIYFVLGIVGLVIAWLFKPTLRVTLRDLWNRKD